jgi:hypothetical protein
MVKCWALPLRAASWLLLPLFCVAGSCIHVLHAIAAVLTAVSLHMLHHTVYRAISAVLRIVASCCMAVSFATSTAALVTVLPIAAVVDVVCLPWAVYSAVVGKAGTQFFSAHVWRVSLTAAREGHAELIMAFAVCRFDVLWLCYKLYYCSMQWALKAWLAAVQMVAWLAATYVATAWCNCRPAWRIKLVWKCRDVGMDVQFGAIDLWDKVMQQGRKGQQELAAAATAQQRPHNSHSRAHAGPCPALHCGALHGTAQHSTSTAQHANSTAQHTPTTVQR